ncbi:MAG: DUF2244 domain-containing protein [Alphaproteobacteria bacterium]|nr:DUF2244 domain-containing protein [Alphaproteobacteria bacterium]
MEKTILLPHDFDLVLRPNMSLSRRGFFWLMVFFAAISIIVGGYFWSLGAWPVFGFFGLDIVLLYGAFRMNYRYGKRYETLSMVEQKLVFRQITAFGAARAWVFDPYWVRIKLERFGKDGEDIGALILSSHGKYVSVGAFLAPEERAGLAESLKLTLSDVRGDGLQSRGLGAGGVRLSA